MRWTDGKSRRYAEACHVRWERLLFMAADLRHTVSAFLSKRGMAILLAMAAAATLPRAAQAQIGSARYSSIVVDNATGKVIEAANADSLRYPASLTKLMTLYMAFEAIRDRRITLGQPIPVSGHAASMEPSKLGIVPGSYFTVSDAILGIVTKSANDAACALGELMGGDEEHFAQMMTQRARALGMTQSTFRNASGLPDLQQTTTARDLALLAHHLIQDFPEDYHYFSEPVFYFHGRPIPNHDHMLVSYDGADGLKTGYTVLSGHNLVTSALRGQVRLIGVVLGASSNPERDLHMANLLDDGFEQLGVPVVHRQAPHFRMPILLASADVNPLTMASLRATAAHAQRRPHGRAAGHDSPRQIALGMRLRPSLAVSHAHGVVHKASTATTVKHAKGRRRT
jgi:D-alanyl-D-alanine carboxypeptidase